jgi:glyceraldehyde 3-phosphate dehydrogenase
MIVGGHPIRVYSRRDPSELPWGELGVDLVFECTGLFRDEPELAKHLGAGARFVLLSAPARTETIATVVHGANHAVADQRVISCVSCTTNCITPVMEVLPPHRRGPRRDDHGARLHILPAAGGWAE